MKLSQILVFFISAEDKVDDDGAQQIENHCYVVGEIIRDGFHKIAAHKAAARPEQVVGQGENAAHYSSVLFLYKVHSHALKYGVCHVHKGVAEEKAYGHENYALSKGYGKQERYRQKLTYQHHVDPAYAL